MIPASEPVQRPSQARVMVIDRTGQISDLPRTALVEGLRPGDLVVANDAATIPASLSGIHLPSKKLVEVRLAGLSSLGPSIREFSAIVFGEGDFHTRTEDRPRPPALVPGDRIELGPLSAKIVRLLGHPRLVLLRFDGSQDAIWAGLAHHGHPVQYSHVSVPLAMWDVWTPIAGPPAAFEPPSAGFAVNWDLVARMHAKGVEFTTITHAAGLSSTGDPDLDRRLPFDEPYRISQKTAEAIKRARHRGGRVVAVGTTVVRALEHAALHGAICAGERIASQKIGASTRLQVVDTILSGTHEPGTSHYELLRAFLADAELGRLTGELNARGYRTHEFGDSVLVSHTFSKFAEKESTWRTRTAASLVIKAISA